MRFGPAGNAASFYEQGHKSSVDAPGWLRKLGLDAYEYQCVRGVNVGEVTARAIGRQAVAHDIALSIHAPYYINFGSEKPEHIAKSKRYLLDSLRAARWMGATRVVFHAGSAGADRARALARAREALREVLAEAGEEGLDGIFICPETLGKLSSLGLLDEVLALCDLDERMLPAIDFAHVHAITGGMLTDRAAFAAVLDRVAAAVGTERLRRLHIHFSPVEFTESGERRHRTLKEEGFGPDFPPLAEEIVARGMSPVLICESDGTQAEDALAYQKMFRQLVEKS
ncbi:MAG: TIM barrel protein [Thermoanaerobacterales bacterium]|nr:TIM barrel protein [Thermoanaerobacterales bacterium]